MTLWNIQLIASSVLDINGYFLLYYQMGIFKNCCNQKAPAMCNFIQGLSQSAIQLILMSTYLHLLSELDTPKSEDRK